MFAKQFKNSKLENIIWTFDEEKLACFKKKILKILKNPRKKGENHAFFGIGIFQFERNEIPHSIPAF